VDPADIFSNAFAADLKLPDPQSIMARLMPAQTSAISPPIVPFVDGIEPLDRTSMLVASLKALAKAL
jgi:hypothetical protein